MSRLRSDLISKLGPTAFYRARRIAVLLRYYGRIIYDHDLLFVGRLAPHPLLIDVGANAGQSALCMAMLRPDARIVSFEANADNIRDLTFVRRLLGDRYTYHHAGLSDRSGSAILHVPVVGRTPIPGEVILSRPIRQRYRGANWQDIVGGFPGSEFKNARLICVAARFCQNRCPGARVGGGPWHGGDDRREPTNPIARKRLSFPRHR